MGTRSCEHTRTHQAPQPSYYSGNEHVSTCERTESVLVKYSNLPWELRHHIHTFCVQGLQDNEVIVRRGEGNRQLKLLVRSPAGAGTYHWVRDPTMLQCNPEKIGLVASKEILATYYASRIFMFAHDELECIGPLIKMAAGNLRHVHLQIQPLRCVQSRELELMRIEEAICARALGSLAALRSPQASVEVHIDLTQGFAEEEEYIELIKHAAKLVFRIVGVLERLRLSGLSTNLILEGTWSEKGGMKLCSSSLTSVQDCLAAMREVA